MAKPATSKKKQPKLTPIQGIRARAVELLAAIDSFEKETDDTEREGFAADIENIADDISDMGANLFEAE